MHSSLSILAAIVGCAVAQTTPAPAPASVPAPPAAAPAPAPAPAAAPGPSPSVVNGVPVTGQLGNATVVENNPPGMMYRATFPATAFSKIAYPNGGNVEGEITAMANPNGIGVEFTVNLKNLPNVALGPFSYHLHVDPVPEDGNCTKTLAHLDTFIRGEDPPCNASLPQTCQVGDLSGKYGKITADPFNAKYVDLFASTQPGLGTYFTNRSVVLHLANKTRITCANFVLVGGMPVSTSTLPGALSSSGCPTSSGTGFASASSGAGPAAASASGSASAPASPSNSASPGSLIGRAAVSALVMASAAVGFCWF